MHFRQQTILTRVSPPSQKTIYNFKLEVGHMTKHMKHGRSCDHCFFGGGGALPPAMRPFVDIPSAVVGMTSDARPVGRRGALGAFPPNK